MKLREYIISRIFLDNVDYAIASAGALIMTCDDCPLCGDCSADDVYSAPKGLFGCRTVLHANLNKEVSK